MIVPALFTVILLVSYALWVWRQPAEERPAEARSTFMVVLAATAIACPFLHDSAVGTGEAENYVLALGDALKQLREGHLPLVGQTELAFNGRIHPLRSAPYLFYFGGALDLLTFRQLSAWQIQNLSVALSLAWVPLVTFVGLRSLLRLNPRDAGLIAILLALCPALLALTHSFNLLMTTHAIPWLCAGVVAVAASAVVKKPLHDWVLAASIAGMWWAHPPVAYWSTLTLCVLRLVTLGLSFEWRILGNLVLAALFTLLPVQYVVYSVYTSQADSVNAIGNAAVQAEFAETVMSGLRSAFPKNLTWVSSSGDALSDLQPGLGLLTAALSGLVVTLLAKRGRRWTASAVAVALTWGFLLCVQWPIPGFTVAFWKNTPASLASVTNIWPMQRLGILVSVCAAVGAALGLLAAQATPARVLRWVVGLGIAVSAVQAWTFVHRGWLNRHDVQGTRLISSANNIKLSVISYAIITAPPDFSNGVVAPWTAFRRLGPGMEDKIDNPTAAIATGKVAAEGELRTEMHEGFVSLQPGLTLEPGKDYLLHLDFLGEPLNGEIQLRGTTLHRGYLLPESGGPQAFGMKPGNARWISLHSVDTTPEPVRLGLSLAEGVTPPAPGVAWARYRLVEVNHEALPAHVRSLLPLRFGVPAFETPGFIETPRRMISGYTATVDGLPAEVQRSPRGNVAVAVPREGGEVVVRYDGPPYLKQSLLLALGAWLTLALGAAIIFLPLPHGGTRLAFLGSCTYLAGSAAAAIALFTAPQGSDDSLAGEGPIHLQVNLTEPQRGRSQMVLSSGVPGAGNYAFLEYGADGRLRMGWEAWGYVLRSEWFEQKGGDRLNIVIDSTVLNNPLPSATEPQPSVPNHLRIEVDNERVLDDRKIAFPVGRSSIVVGESLIGGSLAEAKFTGNIVSARRLPEVPRMTATFSNWPFSFSASLSPTSPKVMPLLTMTTPTPGDGVYVRRLSQDQAQLEWWSSGDVSVHSAAFTWPAGVQEIFMLKPEGDRWAFEAVSSRVALESPQGSRDPLVPPVLSPGLNAANKAPVRFLGDTFDVLSRDRAQTTGPLMLQVRFPSDKPGVSEPLFVSGVSGKADLFSVKYHSENQVSFALDHWGVGLSESPPVTIDLAKPHTLVLELPVLYPEVGDSAWEDWPSADQAAAKARGRLLVDGKKVWEFEAKTHPADEETFHYGANQVGASSAQPTFTGEILSASRMGLDASKP